MADSYNRTKSIFQALLVTFLWSTSFIIIKKGLQDIPPLTFAGLRYFTAFIFLLPFLLFTERKKELKQIKFNEALKLILLGILFYSVTQAMQFLGLSLLPAVTVSLLLNFTPLVVVFMAIFTIKEFPRSMQWIGILIFTIGVLIFFAPFNSVEGNTAGFAIMIIGVLANAGSSVLGRNINKKGRLSPLTVTVVSMGTGSVIILAAGLISEPFVVFSSETIVIILWLALINTAFAFTLWNHTLKTLKAMESSIINGTMLIQIAVLSYFFLGEDITFTKAAGILTAAAGALLVQIRLKKTLTAKNRLLVEES